MKPAPFLTLVNRENRLLWAKEVVVKDSAYWIKVTFTDEKLWCWDRPDCWNYHLNDKSLPRDIFANRANGGGGLMIWAGVSWRGDTELAFVTSKIDAVKYCTVLDDCY